MTRARSTLAGAMRASASLVLVVGLLALGACGGDDPRGDDPSPGDRGAPGIRETDASTRETAGPATTTARPVSTRLPLGASIDDIVTAGRGVLGPTDDLAQALTPFLDVPRELLPTPAGAEITEYDLDMARGRPGDEHAYRLRVRIDTSGTTADILTFYEAKLVAAGLTLTGNGETSGVSFDELRFLRFELPTSGDDVSATPTLEVQLPDREHAGWVEVSISSTTPSSSLLNRLGDWPGDVPTLGQQQAKTVSIASPAIAMDGPRDGLALLVSYDVDGTTVAQLTSEVLSELPNETYRLDRHERRHDRIVLERRGFEDVTLILSELSAPTAVTDGAGNVMTVTVSGTVLFSA